MTARSCSAPRYVALARPTGLLPLLVSSSLLLSACMMPPVAPLGEEVDQASLARDEQHLWKQARETSYRLDHSGMRYDDAELDAYLNAVAARLVGEELAAAGLEPRVGVISNPDMNAFAFSNGAVYIHTALLARMDNEAQLAAVLAREYAHVIHRHALMKHRSDRATGNMLAATGLALSGVKGGGDAKLMLQVASMTSMGGYAQALETKADQRAIEMMDRERYDLEQAPKLFEKTIAYLEEVGRQSAAPRGPFAMSKPLHVTQRIGAYRKLIDSEYPHAAEDPNRISNTEVFRRHVRGVSVHQASLELDRGRFESAAITVGRALEVDDRDPDAWLILGEARERSKQEPDLEGALAAYRRALEIDPQHARAHRALGLAYYRDGRGPRQLGDRRSEARFHLARYLEIDPKARDAGYVSAYLAELDGEGEPRLGRPATGAAQ